METEERSVLGRYLRVLLRSYEIPRRIRHHGRDRLRIYDPVHGVITLEGPLITLFETPFIQRLAMIRQLSFAYLIPEYRAAHHTRLEHSLGVMHLMGRLFDSRRFQEGLREHGVEGGRLRELRMEAMIAGLLHDAGHPPFGHGLEPLIAPHGVMLCGLKAVTQHYSTLLVCEYLDSRELFVRDVLEDAGIDVENIKKILLGPEYPGDAEPEYQALNYALQSDMDVDRMDYLLRDLYFTNPRLGRGYEGYKEMVNVLIESAKPVSYQVGRFELVVGFDRRREDAVRGLLDLREQMYRLVYGHRRNTAYELMLSHATYLVWIEMGGISHERTLREIIRLPDPYLLFLLHLSADPYVRELAIRLEAGVPFEPINIDLGPEDMNRWGELERRLVGGMAYSPVYEFEWYLTKEALDGAEGVRRFCGYLEERPICFVDIFRGLRQIRLEEPRPPIVYTEEGVREVLRQPREGASKVRVFVPHELRDRAERVRDAFLEALAVFP